MLRLYENVTIFAVRLHWRRSSGRVGIVRTHRAPRYPPYPNTAAWVNASGYWDGRNEGRP